jgi:alkyldihydroxyacetonephosphate synthase
MTIVDALNRALGPDRVLTSDEARADRRHDYWMVSSLRDRQGRGAPRPACVVRPASIDDVQTAVRLCTTHGAPLVPFGQGSGVVGGVIAAPETVLLDMGAMNRVRSIDPVNLLATFDAGMNGFAAEEAVAERGLTIGHWPQSIALSTVGGWIATRASGQFSTAYGNIEDIVYSVEAVLPDGSLVTLGRGPRAAAGPDLRHLMLGSEGTLGVITGVTLSLRRQAEAQQVSAFAAKTMQHGFDFQREVIQTGWHPPVMRQYDERESGRLHADARACTVIMVHEGPAALVAAEHKAVADCAAAMGLEPLPQTIVQHWLGHRNHVPGWDQILDRGIVADTVEVSAPWDLIGAVYDAATRSVAEIPGCLAASAHSSHVYRSGLNLYFTFAIRPEDAGEMEGAYFESWRRIMAATAEAGGSLSHHHGIGRIRRDWMGTELGDSGVALLQTLKRALDPAGVMNPGVLIPDAKAGGEPG